MNLPCGALIYRGAADSDGCSAGEFLTNDSYGRRLASSR